ncbi:uncharacterized protein [Diadema setosum]|uniref:uncharacterized protein n=1 Tax=Diadema setosum TaxID=31175 RepID=UPI003B3B96CD
MIFEPKDDLHKALALSLGQEKHVSPSMEPSLSRRSSVSKINVLVDRTKNTSWGLSNIPQSFHDGYVDCPGHVAQSVEEQAKTSEVAIPPLRRKISVPIEAMTTPSRTSLNPLSTLRTSVEEATHQGFVPPKTPTRGKKSMKKVKTPLQIKVSDKVQISSDSDIGNSSKASTTPRKVSVCRATVSCQSPRYQVVQETKQPKQDDQECLGIIILPDKRERKQNEEIGEQKIVQSIESVTAKGEASLENVEQYTEEKTRQERRKKPKLGSRDKALEMIGESSTTLVQQTTHDGNASGDIATRPYTRSQNEINQDVTDEHEHKTKGKRKGGKSDPASKSSGRVTRSSSSKKSSDEAAIPTTLQQSMTMNSKQRKGKKFKLYSDTTILMAETIDQEQQQTEMTEKGRKNKRQKRVSQNQTDQGQATLRNETDLLLTLKGKEKKTEKSQRKWKKGKKEKPSSDPCQNTGNVSEENRVPIKMSKEKPTKGVMQSDVERYKDSKLTADDLMNEPDSQDKDESYLPPQIDENSAAHALAVEHAGFLIPSSVPDERCTDIIPDSQPVTMTRRSGRFPSPFLSDITEESTISKSTPGRKSSDLACGNVPNLLITRSTSRPQSADADSTSHLDDGKDPYSFEESSNASSSALCKHKNKTHHNSTHTSGDSKKVRKAHSKPLKNLSEGEKNKDLIPFSELHTESNSQNDFTPQSHKVSKTLNCEFHVERNQTSRQGKSRLSSKIRMTGKLDGSDEQIESEMKKSSSREDAMEEVENDQDILPDIEVAREVSQVTEAYQDTDISQFVKSIMQSLPKQKDCVSLLKESLHDNKQSSPKTETRDQDKKDKCKGGRKVRTPLHNTEKELDPDRNGGDSVTHAAIDGTLAAVTFHETGRRRNLTLKNAHDNEQTVRESQLANNVEIDKQKLLPQSVSQQKARKKYAHSELSDTKLKKGSSAREDDKNMTEDNRSNDSLLTAHIDSILESTNQVEENSWHTDSNADFMTSGRSYEELSQEEIVQKQVEDVTSRRSKILAALEDSTSNFQGISGEIRGDIDREAKIKQLGKKSRRERKVGEVEGSEEPSTLKPRKCDHKSKNDMPEEPYAVQSPGNTTQGRCRKTAKAESRGIRSMQVNELSKNDQKRSTERAKHRTHFGPHIEEFDTEDTGVNLSGLTTVDDAATEASVESFRNLCKNFLKSSGKSIAAGRRRRNVPRVDYTEVDNSYSESDVETSLQTPVASTKQKTKTMSTSVYEFEEDFSTYPPVSPANDVQSERSWLQDKPKLKVSTYSKTKSKVIGFSKITTNLETVKKANSHLSRLENGKAPKKRKSQDRADEIDDHQYYYHAELELQVKKGDPQKFKGAYDEDAEGDVSVKKMRRNSCRRSLIDCMRDNQSSNKESQDETEERREEDKGEDDEEQSDDEEMIPATPALTLDTVTSQTCVWTPGSSIKTPKQLSFLEDDGTESAASVANEDYEKFQYPTSGPSKVIRPSESSLKRKYPYLVKDDNEEDTDEEEMDDEGQDDAAHSSHNTSKNRRLNFDQSFSLLEPEKVFSVDENKLADEHPSDSAGGAETCEGISDHSVSSSWDNLASFPAMQLTDVFGLLRNKYSQQMLMKRTQTKKLTETVIQSTKKQMDKLFMELHEARRKGQGKFQQSILSELVQLEQCLEKLHTLQAHAEQLLKLQKRKSTEHAELQVKRIRSLHTSFLEQSRNLEGNISELVQQVFQKEMKMMQQKLFADMKQEQMQKTLQSLLLFR